MSDRLRFTGAWPPQQHWQLYPNWEYALDEEGIEGQDETTIRPASVQDFIDDYVAFTVGEVVCANGIRMPALLEVFNGPPDAVNAFVSDEDSWRVVFSYPERCWSAYVESWLPENERSSTVSLEDSAVFPLTVESRLPRRLGGSPYQFVIHPDGTASELE